MTDEIVRWILTRDGSGESDRFSFSLNVAMDPSEPHIDWLRSLSCPVNVQVHKDDCLMSLVLQDVRKLKDRGKDILLEISSEDAERLSAFLEHTNWTGQEADDG